MQSNQTRIEPATAETVDVKLVAVPEARELETLSLLLKNRGLSVFEVPLVAIVDAPDPAIVQHWLREFIAAPPDLFVLLTGEGLRRLLRQAEVCGLREQFVTVLGAVPTLCRGPKPERVLRELGLAPQWLAAEPTSAGVLATAQQLPLVGWRIALQLYGQEPNLLLQDGLRALGASVSCVAPYSYASKSDELRVLDFIARLSQQQFSMVAFTAQTQVKRLLQVAEQHQLQQQLAQGLQQTPIAAVGPVVKEQLEAAGFPVAVMPERVYFMKPLVAAMLRYLQVSA
jgi:uroporphyrinogen-III synthase